MSTHYQAEPAVTASATLNTTFGPLHVGLFAKQAPLACRNFLQHCHDGYYSGTIFHRISPGFLIQGGDPSGTGSGGISIYEYPEFEYDPESRDPNEKVMLKDELHSRLRFNRRGLVGMAKSEDGSYGSQFFITLASAERELNGQCTLFGRVEGDSIFNVLKIAETERIDGTERPVYPVKITSCEVGELGPLEGKLKKRLTTAAVQAPENRTTKKKRKTKTGKTLLSFGDDEAVEGEEGIHTQLEKPKFNPKLVSEEKTIADTRELKAVPQQAKDPYVKSRKRPRSPSGDRHSSVERRPQPKSPDPLTQLPLPQPESPTRSPTTFRPSSPPPRSSILSRTNAEIESIKASMRRSVTSKSMDSARPKAALEAMIPETAIRGRKRPPSGGVNGPGRGSAANGGTGFNSATDHRALREFNAFKSKLESADNYIGRRKRSIQSNHETAKEGDADEEAPLCDLHFIANCQSCQAWDKADGTRSDGQEALEDDSGWMGHELRFEKDTMGKDLRWKQEHPDNADSLMVIDPRAKEKEIVGSQQGRKRGLARDRERERKKERAGELEWERPR